MMTYPEALDRLAKLKAEAQADTEAGLHATREYYEMTLSLVAQTFNKTEDEVRSDMVATKTFNDC